MNNNFSCEFKQDQSYIVCNLSGQPSKEGFNEASSEILNYLDKTGLRKILYDVSGVDHINCYAVTSQRILFINQVAKNAQKIAMYIPDLRLFVLTKFVNVLSGMSNWHIFRTKEKAVEWLTDKVY